MESMMLTRNILLELTQTLIEHDFLAEHMGVPATSIETCGYIAIWKLYKPSRKDLAEITITNKGELSLHRFFEDDGFSDDPLNVHLYPLSDPNCFTNLINTLKLWTTGPYRGQPND